MGDYARRISDGQRIKVGTCGAMYYCRWEQANEITDCDFSKSKCAWRIPLPSEDGIKPGEFDSGLLMKDGSIPYDLMLYCDNFSDEMQEGFASSTGIAQAYVEKLGMLINITCHHGIKLPQGTKELSAHWNGKRDALYLCFLENDDKELLVGIGCSACGSRWTAPFNEIEPFIRSIDMKMRLFKQCTEYWYEHNTEPCPYEVKGKSKRGRELKLVGLAKGVYDVSTNGNPFPCINFEDCSRIFLGLMQEK